MLSQAQLRNLESRVQEEEPHYFAEAVRNFRSKSYMSCVVMLSNAVHRHAYKLLECTVAIDHRYSDVLKDVKARSNNGEAYETPLANGMRGADLITEEKYRYLEELRSARNRAAHPKGDPISDSETAVLLNRGVELFLAERHLDPKVTVDEIVERLEQPGYFPRHDDSVRLAVVEAELALLPSKAYPRLVEQILKSFRSGDDVVLCNGISFLQLCCSLKDNADVVDALLRKLIKAKLGRKVADPDPHMAAIVAVLEIWPEGAGLLHETERKQLDALFSKFLQNFQILEKDLRRTVAVASKLSTSGFSMDFDSYASIKATFSRSPLVGLVLLSDEKTTWRVRSEIVKNLAQHARHAEPSSNFSRFVDLNGDRLADALEGREAFRLLTALEIRRTGGPRGENFGPTGAFRIDPLEFQEKVADPLLDRFEDLLKPKVAGWAQADRQDAPRIIGQHRTKFPGSAVTTFLAALVTDQQVDRLSQTDTAH